ncbi:glycosyltransferase [Pontibacter silvestris]|uniref:Glycosyltransferase n=1 Tax=Pontibacter silvestris TaxID=2305183 RepID=A0ABW4X3D1_9BACT|nr:glycosyltransferase [Pontibacter silvestris]MCC9138357.1 glycosyltransferase [Pontibacter silvestris]
MATKRIVISTYGSLGDLYPYLAIGQVLANKGHQVTIAGGVSLQKKVEELGLAFAPLRPNLDLSDSLTMKSAMDLRTGSETLARKLIFPYIRENYNDLTQAVQQADLLINHSYCFAGPIVSEKTGIPWISCNLSPNNFWSPHDSPVIPMYPWMVHLPGLGLTPNRLLMQAVRMVTHQWCAPIYQFRKELGLPNRKHPLMEGQHSPYQVLALFSNVMARKQSDWPAHASVTGFPFFQENKELPMEVEQFIQRGEPPVVVALGSSVVLNAEAVYQCCQEVITEMGKRAIFVGAAHTLSGEAKAKYAHNDNILLGPYLPYASLFKKSALIIHHGGIGTTMEALRAGKPMLVIPHSFDQPDNALRVERLGVGRYIYSAHFTKERLGKALQLLLNDAAYAAAAQEAAQVVRQENGAETASEHIDRFVQQM